MAESTAPVNAYLEVVFDDRPKDVVSIHEVPFFIGRGRESGNHLSLDDMRISRKCAAISAFVGDPAYVSMTSGHREVFTRSDVGTAGGGAEECGSRVDVSFLCATVAPPRLEPSNEA